MTRIPPQGAKMMALIRRLTILLCLFPLMAAAQSVRIEERLPSKTRMYSLLRGSAQRAAVRGSNPWLRMANDPELIATQLKWVQAAYNGAPVPAWIEKAISGETGDIVVGYIEGKNSFTSIQNPETAVAALMSNYFLIMHNLQKIDLAEAYRETLKSAAGKSIFSTLQSAGRTVTKVEIEKLTYYITNAGEYICQAGSLEMLNDLAVRMQSPGPPADSITQTAFWKESRKSFTPGASMETFVRFSGMIEGLPIPPAGQGVDTTAIMNSLHLDRIHGIAASVTFTAEHTQMHFSMLGDTTPGSLFDFFAASEKNSFGTLAAAPAGTQLYSSGRVDLAQMYRLIRSVMMAAAPRGQGAAMADAMESGLAQQFGMPVVDALKLFAGEFASIATDFTGDPMTQTFVVSIQNQEGVLRVLRVLFGGSIAAEEVAGKTTFLTYLSSYIDEKTKAQRKRFYTIGISPDLIVFAQRKIAVKETFARMANSVPEKTLSGDARFTESRARLPQSLTGMVYVDLTKMEWAKIMTSLADSMRETEKKAEDAAKKNPNASRPSAGSLKASELLQTFPSGVLGRYLHTLVGGWWKDSAGIHYDGYLN